VVNLEQVNDELYRLPPDQFTATRDQRASEAKQRGDRATASAIKKLRRPSASAWLANLLVRERRDEIEMLLDLGAALRDAQDRLAGGELRDLARRRQEVIGSLSAEAHDLAERLHHPVSESAVADLRATLLAALSDATLADELRRGSLSSALHYSGTGFEYEGARVAEQLGSDKPRSASGAEKNKPDTRERSEAKKRAEQELTAAVARVDEASKVVRGLDLRLERLRKKIGYHERTLEELREEERGTLQLRKEEQRRLRAAAVARERAERNVSRIQGNR
jgi:hypothetical protein